MNTRPKQGVTATFRASLFLSALSLLSALGLPAQAGTAVITSSNGKPATTAIITGPKGMVTVHGDKVEVKNGRVTLNGAYYGTVTRRSVVKYTVKNGVRKLYVNGKPVHPLKNS